MIDHNVMRLDITVHDAFAVAVVERLEQFENVVSYVIVLELGVQTPEVGVVDIFEYQRRGFALFGVS
jgi:hypothetical protein